MYNESELEKLTNAIEHTEIARSLILAKYNPSWINNTNMIRRNVMSEQDIKTYEATLELLREQNALYEKMISI